MPEQDGKVGVWYVDAQGLVLGYALTVIPAVAAVVRRLSVAIHRDAEHVSSAALITAIAVGAGLFSWWNLLRVRWELTADMITMVNPWGTQRLPWTRVSALTHGSWGARFHTVEGVTCTAYALSDLAAGRRQDRRLAELQRTAGLRLREKRPLRSEGERSRDES
ncbi:hypothetical protein ACFYXS_09485 [Streptomyces sp. NPDC002574]|uniref:hypothetical protein n=1 Tax=Streptomyces sp. NPDC002574 TaxID=3364652 RepID=UPI0036B27A7A